MYIIVYRKGDIVFVCLFGMPCTSTVFVMFFHCYLETEILLELSGKIYSRELTVSQALVDRQNNVDIR